MKASKAREVASEARENKVWMEIPSEIRDAIELMVNAGDNCVQVYNLNKSDINHLEYLGYVVIEVGNRYRIFW
jgi:hypothetical protein